MAFIESRHQRLNQKWLEKKAAKVAANRKAAKAARRKGAKEGRD